MYVIAYECDTQGVVSHGELRVRTVKNSLKGEEEKKKKKKSRGRVYVIRPNT